MVHGGVWNVFTGWEGFWHYLEGLSLIVYTKFKEHIKIMSENQTLWVDNMKNIK